MVFVSLFVNEEMNGETVGKLLLLEQLKLQSGKSCAALQGSALDIATRKMIFCGFSV